jgi:hypothetical protein
MGRWSPFRTPSYHDRKAAAGAEAARGKAVPRRRSDWPSCTAAWPRPATPPICSAGSSTPIRRGARPARRARADAEQAITTAKQDLAGLGETVQRLRGERRQTQHALDMLAHQPHRRVRGRPRPQVSV